MFFGIGCRIFFCFVVKAKRGLEQPRSLYVKAAPVPDKQSKMAKSSLNNLNRDLKTKTAERKLERQPEVIESKYKSNMQRRPWEKSQAFFFIEASIKALSQQRPQITAAR